MNSFQASYDKILSVLHQIEKRTHFIAQIRKPKLSDIEIIAMNLTGEYLGIDSEHEFFRRISDSLSSKIERSVYNRRKRRLSFAIEQIRLKLASYFNEFEEYFIVDSMPLEVCKLARSSRSTICKESSYCFPDKGYCASHDSKYYGYKLHAVCSISGVFQSIDLSPDFSTRYSLFKRY